MKLVASASRAALTQRAALLARIRAFFAGRGVLEVETPSLSAAATPDLAIESMTVAATVLGPQPHYLHTSPEYAMKRLLAAGSGDIYQLCRVFRDGELGRWHQPEFTMLEWYRVGWDELTLMDEVEALVDAVLAESALRPKRERHRFADAFERALGIGPDAAPAALEAALAARAVDVPPNTTPSELLDLAVATCVAPSFGADTLTFVYDYPASQAALAEIKPGPPPVAARFELFWGEVELANGFRELRDAAEQRRRFDREREQRRAAGRTAPPLDEAFLACIDTLPPCAGVALGVDRLLALALGFDALAPAIPFVCVR
jgi:lysyl-tRNA synthetase class 2